jgi:pilus assembly protein Flp/PilA
VRGSRGQKAIDYIIIVALVAVAAIGSVSIFGQSIRELFSSSASTTGDEHHLKSQTNPVTADPAKP